MDAKVKAKWVTALRSGKYRQGQYNLRDDCDKYCCLGVLCDILNPNGWHASVPEVSDSYIFQHGDDDRTGSVPTELLDKIGVSPIQEQTLIQMNDAEGLSFDQIANYIEREL